MMDQPSLSQATFHQASFRRSSFREGPEAWRRVGTQGGTPAFGRRMWLITFTDLVSLMLAFFVMLFAMSGVKLELWEVMSQSFAGLSFTRTLEPSPPSPPPVAARNVPLVMRAPALDLDYLAALLHRGPPGLVETRLTRVPDGLLLVLRPRDIFEGEGVRLSPAAAETFSAVGGILGNFSNRIGVRLHADPARPLEAGDHPAAWERALVRAATVANALRAAGYDREIAAYGLTDGGLPASGGQGELTEDERIEIVILAESASGS